MTQKLMALVLGNNMVFNVEYKNRIETADAERLKEIVLKYTKNTYEIKEVPEGSDFAFDSPRFENFINELMEGLAIGTYEEWYIGSNMIRVRRVR